MVTQINDFNGDSTSDVLLYDSAGNYIDWTVNSGTYSGWNEIGNPVTANGYVVAGTGDYNGDGTTDLLLYSSSTGIYIDWILNNGKFAEYFVLSTSPTDVPPNPVVGNPTIANFSDFDGGADFNGDGTTDLLAQNANGMLVVLLMDDGFVYPNSIHQINIGNPTVSGFSVAGTGDFNNDGISDILLENSGGGLIDWLMSNGHYVTWNPVGNLAGSGYSVIGTGDFNGDGSSDILLQNASGNLIDWMMHDGIFVGWNEIGNPVGWTVAGVGDFNHDNRTDLLLQDTSGNLIDWTLNNGTFSGWHPIGAAGPSGYTAIQPPK
jgi:hypothetical protein